ncbi:MAG: DUF4384 domain-containing protein [Deltaproteobacteria bacterium]|nr:DUF4384 domain-containing protein [Deltaproteobacteria bacterium]
MSVTKPTSPCPSELLLDRYRLSDLPEAQHHECSAHIDQCPRCAERLVILKKESIDFAEGFNIPNLVVDALQRAEKTSRPWWASALRPQWLGAIAAASVGVMAMVLLWPQLTEGPPGLSPEPGAYRIKGGFSIAVRVKRGERQWQAKADTWFEPGDNIRFIVTIPSAGYLYVVGIDASRTVTLYEPYGGERARRLQPGDAQAVPGAIELDDTLGDERVIALLCKNLHQSKELLATAQAVLAKLTQEQTHLQIRSLPLKCAQKTMLWRKRAHHR